MKKKFYSRKSEAQLSKISKEQEQTLISYDNESDQFVANS